jgi:hypothetical protein
MEIDKNKNEYPQWVSLAELAPSTPYSAEYLSLLARKKRINAKKIDGVWHATKGDLVSYIHQQQVRHHAERASSLGVSIPLVPKQEEQKSDTEVIKKLNQLQTEFERTSKTVDALSKNISQTSSIIPDETSRINTVSVTPPINGVDQSISADNLIKKFDTYLDVSIESRLGFLHKCARVVKNAFSYVAKHPKLWIIVAISVALSVVLPIRSVFGFFDDTVSMAYNAMKDAQTVLGFRPGTHANEILLLNKKGDISIIGHIETEGQFRSFVQDGIAPIVVESKTKVENLNVDYLDGVSSEGFTLAFVTKNGNVTYDDVYLEGSVEVGKTLLVKGATHLLSSLQVDGDIGVFGDALLHKSLTVEGPTYLKALLTASDVIARNIAASTLTTTGAISGRDVHALNSVTGDSMSARTINASESISAPIITARDLVATSTLDVQGNSNFVGQSVFRGFAMFNSGLSARTGDFELGLGTSGNFVLGSNKSDGSLTTKKWYVRTNGDSSFKDIVVSSCSGCGGGSGTVNAGVAGSLAFYSSSGTTVDDADALTFDDTNNRLGVGTSSPYAALSVVGEIVGANFTGTTSATSTFGGPFNNTATASSTFTSGIDIASGCFAVNGTCVGTSGSAFPFTVDSNFAQLANATSTQLWLKGSPISLSASSTSVFEYASTSQLTISGGRTYYTTSSTSTIPQAVNAWSIATSTSANPLISIDGSTGSIGFGTTTPRVVGSVSLPSGVTGFQFAASNGSSPFVVIDGAFPNLVLFDDSGTANQRAFGMGLQNQGGNPAVRFDLVNDSLGVRYTPLTLLQANGFVGLGTTTPSQQLSVHGNGLISGDLSLANLTATGTLTVSGLSTLGNASTTLLSTSYASSTNYYGANLSTCDPTTGKLTWASGFFGCGTDQAGSGSAFPFTVDSNFAQLANATSTQLWLKGSPISLSASSTSVFEYASTSQLTISGGRTYYTTSSTSTIPQAINAWSIATSSTAKPIFSVDGTSGNIAMGSTLSNLGASLDISRNIDNSFGIVINNTNNGGSAASAVVTMNDLGHVGSFGITSSQYNLYPYLTDKMVVVDASANGLVLASLSSTTQFYNQGVERARIDLGGNLGVASTSPWGLLSVNPNGISGPAFVIGSSTATKLIVTNGGNVGISTTSPGTLLSLGDTTNFINLSHTSTSTFSNGINVSGGNIKIATLTNCNGNSVVETDSLGNFQCGSDAGAGGGISSINLDSTSAQTLTAANNNSGYASLVITDSSPDHLFTLSASSTPTYGFVNATSTTATSTFQLLAAGTAFRLGNDYIQDVTGNSLQITNGNTLDTIQDIRTSASPTLAGLTLTGFSGAVSASGGVLSAGTLGIANGGTNATSFTTSGNALYYTGSALATAPLTSAITTPYASSTGVSTAYASSTNYYGANLATCDSTTGKLTWANGFFGCGTDFNTGGGGGFAWTPTIWGGVNANSTSTLIQFLAGTVSATSSVGTLTVGSISATSTRSNYFGGNVGIASTSPWGLLALNPNGISGPSFVIGSSTKTDFIVTNGGRVGINIASSSGPVYPLDVRGVIKTDSQLRATSLCDYRGSYCNNITQTHWSRLSGDGTASSSVKIASGTNGGPTLVDGDWFGKSATSIGDLNGDGVSDVVVGAPLDDTGSVASGAVHVLFMNRNGSAASTIKIASATNGGPTLGSGDLFGESVASIGDLNGDGVPDLVVGADGTNANRGAVYVLFMNQNGSVNSSVKIGSGTNGGPTLSVSDFFGKSVASVGDVNGDGVPDLAVGTYWDDTNGTDRGAVYILFMNRDGTANSSVKIASGTNGGPTLTDSDEFGYSVSSMGDLNSDGTPDIVVGARLDNTGATDSGAAYVIFMNSDGTANSSVKIASGTNGGPTLTGGSNWFGASVSSIGDLNGDGVSDLAIGEPQNATGGAGRGAIYIFFMNQNGTANSFVKIASGTNGGPSLTNIDNFGDSIALIGDLNGDGISDLVVGAAGEDTGGSSRGAIFTLFMAQNNIYFSLKNMGVATSSPWGLLSVNPNGILGPSFVVGSSTATNFIIDSGGRVGIGTTSPYSLLTIYKAGATAANSPQLVLSASSTVSNLGNFLNNWAIGTDSADGGKFKISSSTVIGTNDRFVIDGNGRIGIGTTSPSQLLAVQGNTLISGNITSVANITATGTVTLSGASGSLVLSGTTNCNGLGTNSTGAASCYIMATSTSVNNSLTADASLNADRELKFLIGANEKWSFVFNVFGATAGSTADSIWGVSAPSGATCSLAVSDINVGSPVNTAACAAVGGVDGEAGVVTMAETLGNGHWIVSGTVINGATPGTVNLLWAQKVSNANAMTINKGGSLLAFKLNTTDGADIAEVYLTKDTNISPGSIISLDTSLVKGVNIATSSENIIGVVSTKPSQIIGREEISFDTLPILVALAGRVPVNVSDEGGAIQPGDTISLSSHPGIGKKASPGETTIGIAMEAFEPITEVDGVATRKEFGSILVFVNLHHPELPDELDAIQKYYETQNASSSVEIENTTPSDTPPSVVMLAQKFGNTMLSFFKSMGIEIANGFLKVKDLVAETLFVDKATIADLDVKQVNISDGIKVGSSDKPIGITIYDQASGNPMCVFSSNGVLTSQPGECEKEAIPSGGSGTAMGMTLPDSGSSSTMSPGESTSSTTPSSDSVESSGSVPPDTSSSSDGGVDSTNTADQNVVTDNGLIVLIEKVVSPVPESTSDVSIVEPVVAPAPPLEVSPSEPEVLAPEPAPQPESSPVEPLPVSVSEPVNSL